MHIYAVKQSTEETSRSDPALSEHQGRHSAKKTGRRTPVRNIWPQIPFPILFPIRTARVGALSLFFLLVFLLGKLFRAEFGPRLFRWYLETCGAGFIKLGQFLAMRYDFLPEAYCMELSRLLDEVEPESLNTVVRIIESDLGKPLDACFRRLETEPLGSASIAQVHRAILCSGENVVVKVKRAGIEARFRVDLANITAGAYILDRIDFFHRAGLRR